MGNKLNQAILLLGSNLGNKEDNLKQAIALIENRTGRIINISDVYKSEPWGNAEQDEFVNQAILLQTSFAAVDLLQMLLNIELTMGRRREGKWGPRIIDIDILDYNGEVIQNEELICPHPYLPERMFALKPLQQLLPNWIHPILNKSVSELIANCNDENKVEAIEK